MFTRSLFTSPACGSSYAQCNLIKAPIVLLLICLLFISCASDKIEDGPYFGNGFRNGWADQHSVVVWTRLTRNPEMNFTGGQWMVPSDSLHRALASSTDSAAFYSAQMPDSLTLDEMEGACPGAAGEVQLSYFPSGNPSAQKQIDWKGVDPEADFTTQWHLSDLLPDTEYEVTLLARNGEGVVSDTFNGKFITAPAAETVKPVDFVVVTCHDYWRRDDGNKGHKIYPVMLAMQPDFYVHTGDIEYYDKPEPYALTEELMHYHWNRLFALPNQRDFYRQVTTYFMKDDHDVLKDDAYPGMTYGTVSFEKGLEIFDKVQFPSHDKPYKTIRWGKDLQIWLIEGRNYRSQNNIPDGPDKTIWGPAQIKWFYETVENSDATFKILISSTPILGPDRETKNDNYANATYAYEGNQIRQFIDQQKNMFICNGDRHWQYVSHPEGTNLWEFSCGAGADEHAGGWSQANKKAEHKFLRVDGGFLSVQVSRSEEIPAIRFQHHDIQGTVVNEEVFMAQ